MKNDERTDYLLRDSLLTQLSQPRVATAPVGS
jgi:hypothetical protein